MIKLSNLTVDFGGVRALNNLSVDLTGDFNGIIGPNGAGKSTLLNVLSGFVKPSNGSVVINEQNLSNMSPAKRARWGIRRTFQTEQIIEDLSLEDNIAVMLDHSPSTRAKRHEAVHTVLEYLSLSTKANVLGQSLNLFERRMTEIGRTLAGNPKVILMDEPGAGLSQSESEQLQAIILGIPDFCGAKVYLIDHDIDLIMKTCQQTMVLDFGSLLSYGQTEEVLNDEQVKKAYLGVDLNEEGAS